MQQQPSAPAAHVDDPPEERAAWTLALAAARKAVQLEEGGQRAVFNVCANGELRHLGVSHPDGLIAWTPGSGWRAVIDAGDPRRPLLDLYLPLASATPVRPMTIGHLGQSLDGFIATHSGDSQFVTGPANIVHLHRLRALCDAVVVGAGTVAADDPQLTTRHVEGPSPLRVIFDPGRRLAEDYRVFTDDSAPTLYACAQSLVRDGETHVGCASVIGLPGSDDSSSAAALVTALRERGCSRVFVEGGGVTVSAFLEAHLLDRLHMAIAPLLIGDGRPAIRLPARDALRDCLRPRYRVFRMGGDVLFDCDLTRPEAGDDKTDDATVRRII
jgi:diaminohydroxyphosphoribosylaminopyrimidine deaminase / 5-amino-6-(5-phosphoribosylamino)uracil reductase